MAIKLSDQYPGRANPPSVDYPNGSIKNRSAPGVLDGTPLDQAWANDKEGFFQSILYARGMAANGEVDKVGASQYYAALAADPTEVHRGLPLKSSIAEATAGTNDTKMVTPAGLKAAIASAAGSISKNKNGYKVFADGLILQWGSVATVPADSGVAVNFPIAFPAVLGAIQATPCDGANDTADVWFQVRLRTLTSFRLVNGSATTSAGSWFAIGY